MQKRDDFKEVILWSGLNMHSQLMSGGKSVAYLETNLLNGSAI